LFIPPIFLQRNLGTLIKKIDDAVEILFTHDFSGLCREHKQVFGKGLTRCVVTEERLNAGIYPDIAERMPILAWVTKPLDAWVIANVTASQV
jgi:hypothetical protein